MTTHTEHQQRALDEASGRELDRIASAPAILVGSVPAPAPLTAEVLAHLAWLAASPLAIPQLDKPTLARLLDDRARLLAALRELLRCTALDDTWREPAERALTRVEG